MRRFCPHACSVTWEIKSEIVSAQQREPYPTTGPPNSLYVPTRVQFKSNSLGPDCKIHLPSWPSLSKDVYEYVPTQMCSKQNFHFPTCKTPETPTHTWSSVVSPSPRFSIDWFSKAVHFAALPKLLSALEIAEQLTQHIFRLICIPYDFISDWGPQFTQFTWKSCLKMGKVCPQLHDLCCYRPITLSSIAQLSAVCLPSHQRWRPLFPSADAATFGELLAPHC